MLATEQRPLRWLRSGQPAIDIQPSMAEAIVRGGMYEGRLTANGRHVRYIRDVDDRKPNPWQECWRTTEAAVLQPRAVTGAFVFA